MNYEELLEIELSKMNNIDQAFMLRRWPKLMDRLQRSVSGYVRTIRFSSRDRLALRLLIDAGLVELIDSPGEKGRAYKARASCSEQPSG